MANPEPIDERASLYVLGELSAEETREFEKELARSPVARAAVREVEEGTVALAVCAPMRTAPSLVLSRTLEAIETEKRPSKIFYILKGLWRSGWGAAAACLAGWILYAMSVEERAGPSQGSERTVVKTESEPVRVGNVVPVITNLAQIENPSRDRESIILSNQMVGLQRQVLQLSHSITQQQAMLNDASRIKFHNLVPVNPEQASVNSLSPALQRALFLAMARELGWIRSTNAIQNSQGATQDERLNVEFVDFRTQKETTQDEVNREPETQTKAKEFASATSTSPVAAVIPAFVAGDNLVVALDDTLAPRGSTVTFVSQATGTEFGSTVIGESAVVLTFSNNAVAGGLSLLMTDPSGQTTTIDVNLSGH